MSGDNDQQLWGFDFGYTSNVIVVVDDRSFSNVSDDVGGGVVSNGSNNGRVDGGSSDCNFNYGLERGRRRLKKSHFSK